VTYQCDNPAPAEWATMQIRRVIRLTAEFVQQHNLLT